jgi:hypothetical protein
MMPLNLSGLMNEGLNRAAVDGRIQNEGRSTFEHERSVALRKQLWGLRRSRRRLCTLGMTQPVTHYAGRRAVKIDEIWGSENRADEFDVDFHPVAEHLEDRWVKVWMAYAQGVSLPPVELIEKDGGYYVRDGHHRISVARALGYEMIEAVVTEIMKVE